MTARSGKAVAIVQARLASTRLPGKVLADVGGMPMLAYMLDRVRLSAGLAETWVATSVAAGDDAIADLCARLGVPCFRGDEADVLERYRGAAEAAAADIVVRLTADCPFADPALIDAALAIYRGGEADYVSNVMRRSYPDGLDVEVFGRDTLERTARDARLPALREHVTPYMRTGAYPHLPQGGFRTADLVHQADFGHLRWTVDRAEDLAFVRAVVPKLPAGFGWLDLVALLTREADLLQYNRRHRGRVSPLATRGGANHGRRGYAASNALFERATRTIPLGSQTFSKSHMQWVRGAAPLFATRGHGCRIVDPDGNEYIDYVLALLPVILGYGDAEVDAAIVRQLESGIVFSLAHPLEADLAERLKRLVPCAEMARFGKNGSDATTAAIRLARAHTGRDRVAICGYHGWHDWYIGTTARHLGVPAAVRALSETFAFNDTDALEKRLRAAPEAFAAIILEPDGTQAPAPGFLARLREIADRHGIVLVFDEIITGFRIDLGGAQKRHGVVPDLGTFGKAMANGMPISAVVGRREIMRRMEDIFFSATFGGETLSLAAALATLDKLERLDVPARLARRGDELRERANAAFARHGMGGFARFEGPGWWPRFKLDKPPVDAALLNSLLRQEHAANGLLLGASFNLCLAHDDPATVEETIAALERSLAAVRRALDGADPAAHLRGEPVRPVFAVR